jgi:hypothetical protein
VLPLILIVLGAGALAVVALSGRDKSTADAARPSELRPEDDPWDPRYVPKSKPPREQPLAAPPTTNGRGKKPKAPETAPPPTDAPKVARPENGRGQYGKAEAAPAKTDRESTITSLRADLSEANKAKKVAIEMMNRGAGLVLPQFGEPMMAAASASYEAAQERVRTIEAELRKLGVNPLAIPAPVRRDAAR